MERRMNRNSFLRASVSLSLLVLFVIINVKTTATCAEEENQTDVTAREIGARERQE